MLLPARGGGGEAACILTFGSFRSAWLGVLPLMHPPQGRPELVGKSIWKRLFPVSSVNRTVLWVAYERKPHPPRSPGDTSWADEETGALEGEVAFPRFSWVLLAQLRLGL